MLNNFKQEGGWGYLEITTSRQKGDDKNFGNKHFHKSLKRLCQVNLLTNRFDMPI